MKIRNGFVSNSSSSSFVICFPSNKSAEQIAQSVIEKAMKADWSWTFEKMPSEKKMLGFLVNFVNKIRSEKSVWSSESGNPITGQADEIFDKYILASFDTGPDAGQFVLADAEKVRSIANENP